MKLWRLYEFGLKVSLLVLLFPDNKPPAGVRKKLESSKASVALTLKVTPPSFVFTGMLLTGTKSCMPSMTQGKNLPIAAHHWSQM